MPKPKIVICVGVLLLSFVLAYHTVLYWLFDDWELDGNYSHGWLVVPIALYLAWERREQLKRAPIRPSKWGFAALCLSMCALAAGTLAAETFVARVSIVMTVTAIVWYVAGSAHVRILRFPVLFLLFMIPIPGIIFNRITFPLQLVASDLGATLLSMSGIPVFREGNLINLANLSLEVAEACSGIRSLISLFTLSLLFGYFFEEKRAIRLLLILVTVPVAILANGLRVAATGIAAHLFGAEAAEGFFHSFSGWVVFGVAALALVVVRRGATAALNLQSRVPATSGA